MTPRITAVLFDLGDTLWHLPSVRWVDEVSPLRLASP
jgi:FMN phosphatase YigB (HAD superfamily)